MTRRSDGTLVIAVWNLFLPEDSGAPKTRHARIKGLFQVAIALACHRLDATHGSLLAAYAAMGKPVYPTAQQIAELRKAAELPAPEMRIAASAEN